MLIATVDSFPYRLMLLLHIATVILGFGGVIYTGLYNNKAMKAGPAAAAVSTINYEINKISEIAIYLVPIFGFALVGFSDKAWKVSQTWIWLSLVLYFIGVGIAHGVLIPTHRKLNAALTSGGTSSEAVGPLNRQMTIFGAAEGLLLVAILVLMIWKPGV